MTITDYKNLIKLLNKIADKIEPNDKGNIELYIRDLARQATFKDLTELVKKA